MFINFTNHPLVNWGEKQREETEKWGKIVEIPFPPVSPSASPEDIIVLAEEYLEKMKHLIEKEPPQSTVVLCQGEFTLVYAMVQKIKRFNQESGLDIKAVSACSDRNTVDRIDEDGKKVKVTYFDFVGYREYPD